MQRCNISIWQEVWLIVPSFYRDSESGMSVWVWSDDARQGSCRCICVLLIPSYQIYKEYIDNDGAMDEETRGVSTFLSRRLLWKQFSIISLSGVSCLRCPVQVSLHFAASTSRAAPALRGVAWSLVAWCLKILVATAASRRTTTPSERFENYLDFTVIYLFNCEVEMSTGGFINFIFWTRKHF